MRAIAIETILSLGVLLRWHLETDVAYDVILSFYFILARFAPSGGQKMFFESHSDCNGGVGECCFENLSNYSHHINVILDRIDYNFWNGSIFISFCRFCYKCNFWKTSEAMEYKNFTNLHKKISGILTPASLSERIQSLLDWINE